LISKDAEAALSSWRGRPGADLVGYEDPAALAAALSKIRALPPLVTSWEVERLRHLLAEAQEGRRFLLQCGDCTETMAGCEPSAITKQLKILLQISLVLAHALQAPIVRVGRVAGQYATPLSSHVEVREGVVLPSYFGDNVNRAEFTAEARAPDPDLLVRAHSRAALTLNFIRSLLVSGFADMHHIEYWDLRDAATAIPLRLEYDHTARTLRNALRFMSAIGEREISELTRTDLYTSHEGHHLEYEAAQAFSVPRRDGQYLLSTHFPWIADDRRSLSGAHVEFFRQVRNPIAVMLGASCEPAEVLGLLDSLNPDDEPGRLTLVTQFGRAHVAERLPPLIEAVMRSGRRVLWVSDPMHGNTRHGPFGQSSRRFEDILAELSLTFDAHELCGSRLGGIHFELTGDDVTECVDAPSAERAHSTGEGSSSHHHPRLNYRQALEASFYVAGRLEQLRADVAPPSRG
jgi:3-deoxy-7-phosphoheptulonate synthase